jgi:hypothetical protein
VKALAGVGGRAGPEGRAGSLLRLLAETAFEGLIFQERQLVHVLAEYATLYNSHRPQRSLETTIAN